MEGKKIVVANLKMNLNIGEISNYLKEINEKIESPNVVICPTSIYIPYFLNKNFSVGIQNIYSKNEGAFTGEISPRQAISMGIRYAIIGHSERRNYFEEKDSMINEKVKASLEQKITPIFCIGETIEQKSMLRTERVLKQQILMGLRDMKKDDLEKVYIAYEPVWSIGSGEIPTNLEIERIVEYIKLIVSKEFDYSDIKVLYGGSVNEKNISELNQIKNLSGYLVGGASLDPNKLLSIVNEVIKV